MVNKKWVRLPWFGLTSTRYFYTVLPNQQRIIVDYGSGFPNLLGLPYINRKKKYAISMFFVILFNKREGSRRVS